LGRCSSSCKRRTSKIDNLKSWRVAMGRWITLILCLGGTNDCEGCQ